jgi:thiol-disulfide isomerase/thioredoxin
MRNLFTVIASACLTFISTAQNNFTINGKIERLSQSSSVIILSSSGEFNGTVDPKGNFQIKGIADTPGTALIKTDSSGADAIWLERGEYNITCKEIQGINFRISSLKGPKEAEIYHGFLEPMYYPKGATKENTRQYYKNHFTGYIDSIFKSNPSSAALPEMIGFSRGYIGDEAAETYFSFLSSDQKDHDGAKQVAYYFKRKEKIQKEKLFENFSMISNEKKDFQLSSITGKKLILIDFWSSDCYPCRSKHKKLVELYAKYAGKGLEIVSVSLDDNKADWLNAIEKDKMTWINVSELKGWNTSLALNYFIKSLPYALWLDGNRKIIGPELSEKEIELYLE